MRIRRRDLTKRIIIDAYECDNCSNETIDSVLPTDWPEDSKNTHYCADCIEELGVKKERSKTT